MSSDPSKPEWTWTWTWGTRSPVRAMYLRTWDPNLHTGHPNYMYSRNKSPRLLGFIPSLRPPQPSCPLAVDASAFRSLLHLEVPLPWSGNSSLSFDSLSLSSTLFSSSRRSNVIFIIPTHLSHPPPSRGKTSQARREPYSKTTSFPAWRHHIIRSASRHSLPLPLPRPDPDSPDTASSSPP